MSLTTKEGILKVLNAYNPWWKTGTTNAALTKSYKRFAFYEAMERMENQSIRRTVVLSGTRRVGKTTIMYQMIDALLKKGVSARRILFVSLDHPMLKLSAFNDILDCFHETIYPDNDVYYFFDEIQYAQDWDKWLKTIYDMNPETKIVATGSASPALMKGNELIGVTKPRLDENFKVSSFSKLSSAKQSQIMMQLSDVQKHFNRYLQVGGFPELALSDNDMMAQQIMREDVVDKVLKRDLPALYSVRNPTELERIFLYLCNVSSEIVSIDALAKELNGVSRPTVENYIRYLESANLIYQSWPTDLSGKKVLKAKPKLSAVLY